MSTRACQWDSSQHREYSLVSSRRFSGDSDGRLYIDDCLIYTKTVDDHIIALEEVFKRLDEYGLTLGAKKTHLLMTEVRFLGHLVNEKGISPDPNKVEAIKAIQMPHDKKGLRTVLGLFGYYRRFCKGYSRIAQPLMAALAESYRLERNRDGTAKWTDQQIQSFETLKGILTSDVILAHPMWGQDFILDTDACGHGLGAVLSQKCSDGMERVVSYASRALADNERSYKMWELEALAVVWSMQLFGWYFYGSKIIVRTDNNAVEHVLKNAKTGRMLRWALQLQEWDYAVVHRSGQKHANADALSRCHLLDTCPYGEKPVERMYGNLPPIIVSMVQPSVNAVQTRSTRLRTSQADKDIAHDDANEEKKEDNGDDHDDDHEAHKPTEKDKGKSNADKA